MFLLLFLLLLLFHQRGHPGVSTKAEFYRIYLLYLFLFASIVSFWYRLT